MRLEYKTPEERRRLSMCFGKEPYQTPQLARKVADRRQRKGKHVSVYKCPFCRRWHQGHDSSRNPWR